VTAGAASGSSSGRKGSSSGGDAGASSSKGRGSSGGSSGGGAFNTYTVVSGPAPGTLTSQQSSQGVRQDAMTILASFEEI
jgi:hypothetical protein